MVGQYGEDLVSRRCPSKSTIRERVARLWCRDILGELLSSSHVYQAKSAVSEKSGDDAGKCRTWGLLRPTGNDNGNRGDPKSDLETHATLPSA